MISNSHYTYLRSMHGDIIPWIPNNTVFSCILTFGHKFIIYFFMYKCSGASTAVLSMVIHNSSMGPLSSFINCKISNWLKWQNFEETYCQKKLIVLKMIIIIWVSKLYQTFLTIHIIKDHKRTLSSQLQWDSLQVTATSCLHYKTSHLNGKISI